MRFLFASFILFLVSLVLWPWIQQLYIYLKKKYKESTNFEEDTQEKEENDDN